MQTSMPSLESKAEIRKSIFCITIKIRLPWIWLQQKTWGWQEETCSLSRSHRGPGGNDHHLSKDKISV